MVYCPSRAREGIFWFYPPRDSYVIPAGLGPVDMPQLTKRLVDGLKPLQADYFVWDDTLSRFGVRVWPSGKRVFVVQYRVSGRLKRLKIGQFGALTVEEARKLAMSALGDVAKGEDPQAERKTQRKSITVAQLCDRYLQEAERGGILGKYGSAKKRSTINTDKGRIQRHIKPLIGNMLVMDLTQAGISKFMRDVTAGKTAVVERTGKPRGKAVVEGGPGTASRTVGLLGGILSYAISEGILERNPAAGVRRPPVRRTKRRLSPSEYSALGAALAEGRRQGMAVQGLAAIQLLALTGCRKGEIEALRWEEVNSERSELVLSDTKEGRSVRPIGVAALAVLNSHKKTAEAGFVFVSSKRAGQKFGGLPGLWEKVGKMAGFTDVTLHTLRHSYASVAADMGYVETTIAALLGHATKSMTSSYVHHLDSVLVSAADKISQAIQLMIEGQSYADAKVAVERNESR